MSGHLSYLKGMAAEEAVLARYLEAGCRLIARRWRGAGGEIDLVMGQGETVVFVEVKTSRSLAQAAQHLSKRQITRLLQSAEAGLGFFPQGSLTPARFDVALVGGAGDVDIIENALQAI